MGNSKITDERVDEIIRSALNYTADNLEVSERLKEQIDKEIANRIYKQNILYFAQKRTFNLAMSLTKT